MFSIDCVRYIFYASIEDVSFAIKLFHQVPHKLRTEKVYQSYKGQASDGNIRFEVLHLKRGYKMVYNEGSTMIMRHNFC